MSPSPHLVFRRFGVLWAVPAHHVTALVVGKSPEVRVGDQSLEADAVLGVTSELKVVAPGPVFSAFWPFACTGLALVNREPTVVLAPGAWPPLLVKGES